MSDHEIQLRTENTPLLPHGTNNSIHEGGNIRDSHLGREDNVENANGTKHTIVEDIVDTFQLALPIFIARVSFVGVSSADPLWLWGATKPLCVYMKMRSPS